MNLATHQRPTFPNTLLPRWPAARRGLLLATIAASALALLAVAPLHAETPGMALRSYLNARLQGDVETARPLWERLEMRRALAMGMHYEQVEAAYDPYWLMSSEERQQFAQQHRLVLRDSTLDDETAHFTVEVRARDGEQIGDVWRYLVQKTDGGWKVSLPLEHDTRSWTRRESRFVMVHSKRLSRVNTDALHAMDEHVESLFERFATPKAAQLRLERVKVEIFLADSDEDIEQLLGNADRRGYLPAGERIVTREVADLAALTEAVANLTLRKTPPSGAAFMQRGLGLAFGGRGELSAAVYLLRQRNRVLRGELKLETAFSASDNDDVLAAQALWNHALLQLLGSTRYLELYGDLRGTPQAMQHLDLARVRQAIEKATGKKGKALDGSITEQLREFVGNVRSGCETWPADVRNLRSLLSWRDQETSWSMRGYDLGSEYAFALGAYQAGMTSWEYSYIDSIARANGQENMLEPRPETERPEGDPPYIVVTLSPRYKLEPEPYASRLFEKLFSSREYVDEILGFFVTYDLVRVYNYRIDKMIAEYAVDTAAPGDALFYDEERGRVCFRVSKSVFRKPFTDYTPRAGRYIGE